MNRFDYTCFGHSIADADEANEADDDEDDDDGDDDPEFRVIKPITPIQEKHDRKRKRKTRKSKRSQKKKSEYSTRHVLHSIAYTHTRLHTHETLDWFIYLFKNVVDLGWPTKSRKPNPGLVGYHIFGYQLLNQMQNRKRRRKILKLSWRTSPWPLPSAFRTWRRIGDNWGQSRPSCGKRYWFVKNINSIYTLDCIFIVLIAIIPNGSIVHFRKKTWIRQVWKTSRRVKLRVRAARRNSVPRMGSGSITDGSTSERRNTSK